MEMKRLLARLFFCLPIALLSVVLCGTAFAGDLEDVKSTGVLRHLGVPYANFVTGSGDGLDTDMMKLFARHLGVKYEYVKTSWEDALSDLTGEGIKGKGNEVPVKKNAPKGDILANGVTILPSREKIVYFSTPTFPTQVWLLTRADSSTQPIKPSDRIEQDILAVKSLLTSRDVKEVLGKRNTCLDPALYDLEGSGANTRIVELDLNELAPALINGESESILLDAPDAIIALEKWTGSLKIIGPISDVQKMGVAFAKTSPELRDEFNSFFDKCIKDGTYRRLVEKYFPSAFVYFPAFFSGSCPKSTGWPDS